MSSKPTAAEFCAALDEYLAAEKKFDAALDAVRRGLSETHIRPHVSDERSSTWGVVGNYVRVKDQRGWYPGPRVGIDETRCVTFDGLTVYVAVEPDSAEVLVLSNANRDNKAAKRAAE